MDVTISTANRTRTRLAVYALLGIAITAGGAYGLSRIEPTAPEISIATVWVDQVRKGTLNRRVAANGVLVPTTRRVLIAEVPGRVEKVNLLPGSTVDPDTVLLHLSNPEVEIEALNARQQLVDAQSGLVLLRANLEMERLGQLATISEVGTRHLEARHRNEMNKELINKNLGSISKLEEFRSEEAVKDLGNRLEIESKRLSTLDESINEQIRAQELQIENLKELLRFYENRSRSLSITSDIAGQLIELNVDPGEWVASGQELGHVVDPRFLGVEARVAEEFASDLSTGLISEVRLGSEVMTGYVSRVDPAVIDGTITLEVSLPVDLPSAARPNFRVEVIVEVERINSVLHVGRPTHWRNRDSVWAYQVNGDVARRIRLTLGRRSYNEVEILEGAEIGDQLILTDLSQYGAEELLEILE